jgi:hypothetical protein
MAPLPSGGPCPQRQCARERGGLPPQGSGEPEIPDGFQTCQLYHNLVWNFTQTHKGNITWDESCWAHILDGFQGNVLEVDADGQVPNVFNDVT